MGWLVGGDRHPDRGHEEAAVGRISVRPVTAERRAFKLLAANGDGIQRGRKRLAEMGRSGEPER